MDLKEEIKRIQDEYLDDVLNDRPVDTITILIKLLEKKEQEDKKEEQC